VLLLCTRLAYTPLLPYTTLFRSNCTYYYNVHGGKRCFIESYWLGLWICIDIWSWCGSFCTRTSSGKSLTKHDSINEGIIAGVERSEEHTSELQSRFDIVCRLLLE